MRFSSTTFTCLLHFLSGSLVQGAPSLLVPEELEVRAEGLQARAPTCNTPSNRACWSPGFNINTDYETSTPTTGVTRNYALSITEVDNWTGPDGVVKEKVMLVNGKYATGPTIMADWGDTIKVTVTNNLRTNGTSIHWHGLRQFGSTVHDGANGVTECPIPPKASKVYTFRAAQYGTSWYHSHFSAQYGNGVVGTIQINGPASLPYDIDLGVFPLSDYYYRTADELVAFTKSNGAPPSDNVLINGTAIHPVTGAGTRATVTLTKGKRHRLRLINTSVENHFQVSLVNHSMTVIAADMVPVNAYTTSNLFLGVGQRYDVTIDASQAVGNYWFNVSLPNAFCGTTVPGNQPAAIFHYAGAPTGNPTIQGTSPADAMCFDNVDLVPIVSRTASPGNFNPNPGNTLPVHLDTTGSPLFVWKVNGSAIDVDWNKPTLQYVIDGNTSYPANANVISVNSVNQWTYWLIENDPDAAFSLPHPFHLHGHDFLVLGRSPVVNPGAQTRFKFNATTDLAGLKGNNPVRRDVAMLPAKGWLLIAFKTDNPGAWLMHCHIAWHVSGGLSVQFVERAAELRAGLSAADKAVFNNNCAAWRRYFPSQDPFPKSDSGI